MTMDLLESQAHDRFLASLGEGEPGWVREARTKARVEFEELGFPTQRDEDWKYTSVAPIADTRFDDAPANGHPSAAQLDSLLYPGWSAHQAVFVNGRFAPELSRLEELQNGIRVGSLATVLDSAADSLEPHLVRLASPRRGAFTALNTAFLRDGAFVEVPAGMVADRPIHLVFVATPDGDPFVAHPRNLILLGKGSEARVVETYVSAGDGVYWTNVVTEAVVGENATLDRIKIQREGPEAFHIATTEVALQRSSTLRSHSISLGGSLVRNNLNAVLTAEGGDCSLNGLYVGSATQHVDNHTLVDHAQPHCTSREFYKGVLTDRARGVFNGRVIVRVDAQKTDARQTNKNLLLSSEALVNTKPQLEILADDVKCAHGATIGQLDGDAIFYLQTRGIDRKTARSLLIQAFASELVDRIPDEPIRRAVEEELHRRLPLAVEEGS